MHPSIFVPVALGGFFTILAVCWMVVSVVKAVTRRSSTHWGHDGNIPVPPLFEKMLEKAMEKRDVESRALRERIEVLEKIVTDSHASIDLAGEIERLRDKR